MTVFLRVSLHCAEEHPCVVVSNRLLGRCGDGIMMLVDAHLIKHVVLGADDLGQLGIGQALIQHLLCVEEIRGMEIM